MIRRALVAAACVVAAGWVWRQADRDVCDFANKTGDDDD